MTKHRTHLGSIREIVGKKAVIFPARIAIVLV